MSILHGPRSRTLIGMLAGIALLLGSTSRLAAQAPQVIRAPELTGGVDVLGSDRPITLKSLRGKIVILEFWTLC